MAWASTAAAISALRALIFDGPSDKLCSNKKLIGVIDGSNVIFKTFEYRRVTDFSSNATVFPLGIFKNGTPIAYTQVQSDDLPTGTVKLAATQTPSNRDSITATYYYQWYTDTELDTFLQTASSWTAYGTTYINIPDGLNPAVLDFAAREAYRMAAMKYTTRMREIYQLEDAPDENTMKTIQGFQTMAKDFLDSAQTLRDDFYKRQGQAEAPLFGFALGRVSDPTPRR